MIKYLNSFWPSKNINNQAQSNSKSRDPLFGFLFREKGAKTRFSSKCLFQLFKLEWNRHYWLQESETIWLIPNIKESNDLTSHLNPFVTAPYFTAGKTVNKESKFCFCKFLHFARLKQHKFGIIGKEKLKALQ